MSKKLWRGIGIGLFWLAWPALILYLNRTERARILIICGDEVLLVRSWLGTGKWGLPGGGLHHGESPLDGALREVHEETGVMLTKGMVNSLFSRRFRQHGFDYPAHYFVAVLDRKPSVTRQRGEISACGWINRHELSAKNTHADALTTVAAWFEP